MFVIKYNAHNLLLSSRRRCSRLPPPAPYKRIICDLQSSADATFRKISPRERKILSASLPRRPAHAMLHAPVGGLRVCTIRRSQDHHTHQLTTPFEVCRLPNPSLATKRAFVSFIRAEGQTLMASCCQLFSHCFPFLLFNKAISSLPPFASSSFQPHPWVDFCTQTYLNFIHISHFT